MRGSYICIEDENDIYSITNSAFDSTYSIIKKNIEQEPEKVDKDQFLEANNNQNKHNELERTL